MSRLEGIAPFPPVAFVITSPVLTKSQGRNVRELRWKNMTPEPVDEDDADSMLLVYGL